jgi:hypothetical protein
MAVINLVMEAMGTTRSASFASSSSEVWASTTNAIFDFTTARKRESPVSEALVGACFEDGVRVGGDFRVGGGAVSPLCAPNAIPGTNLQPEKKEGLRAAQASAAAATHLQMRQSQGAREEEEVILLCEPTYRFQIRKVP